MEILGVRLRADYGPLHNPNVTAKIPFVENGLAFAFLSNLHTIPEVMQKRFDHRKSFTVR